jgi:hypothetical protein
MTPEERDEMDLYFLARLADVDMSPAAVTERLKRAGELCELSKVINVPYIYYFEADYEKASIQDN